MFTFAIFGIFLLYWIIGVLFVTTNREIKRYDVSRLFLCFLDMQPERVAKLTWAERHAFTHPDQLLGSAFRHDDYPVIWR